MDSLSSTGIYIKTPYDSLNSDSCYSLSIYEKDRVGKV